MSRERISKSAFRSSRRRRVRSFLAAVVLLVILGAYAGSQISTLTGFRPEPGSAQTLPPSASPLVTQAPSVSRPSTSMDELDDELNELVSGVLDEIITDGMTQLEQARAVFDYVHDSILYTGSSDKSDWETGAYDGLTSGRGDCFTYYAVSRAMLTVLGIDNLAVERVGGETHHFWNLVNCGSGWYHFDACPRSSKLPPFTSFMVTDQQAADFTAAAGRNYYDFDGSLLPERATDIITEN